LLFYVANDILYTTFMNKRSTCYIAYRDMLVGGKHE
jgi:hypothetical protein